MPTGTTELNDAHGGAGRWVRRPARGLRPGVARPRHCTSGRGPEGRAARAVAAAADLRRHAPGGAVSRIDTAAAEVHTDAATSWDATGWCTPSGAAPATPGTPAAGLTTNPNGAWVIQQARNTRTADHDRHASRMINHPTDSEPPGPISLTPADPGTGGSRPVPRIRRLVPAHHRGARGRRPSSARRRPGRLTAPTR